MKKSIFLLIFIGIIGFVICFQKPVHAELGDILMATNYDLMKKQGQKPVLFSHGLHRIYNKCSACHSHLYKLKPGVNYVPKKAMIEGKSCGKCHNGVIAFKVDNKDECERCHNYDGKGKLLEVVLISNKFKDNKLYLELERDKWGVINWNKVVKDGKITPTSKIGDEEMDTIAAHERGKAVDVKYEVVSKWVADVLFSHEKHGNWLSCENCHNDDIFPKDYKAPVKFKMIDISEGNSCGKCHNKMSFRLANCKRCHNLPKKASIAKVAKEKERREKAQKFRFDIAEARARQEAEEKKRRELWEAWLKEFNENSAKMKRITPKPETMTNPDTPNGMAYIPDGPFLRGQDWGLKEDNKPSKIIKLSAFYIDRREVTVGQYRAYVRKAKKRILPGMGNRDFGGRQQPIFEVKWEEAVDYCNYYNKRLPTEAEWEKSGRGWDNRYFPWGNELPDQYGEYRANYDPGRRLDDGYRYTSEVTTFRDGASPYGLLHMAGNVWEWTADWYAPDYYKDNDIKDPKGPEKGERKVIRGGSFTSETVELLLTYRSSEKPNRRQEDIGFRCAKSAK